jgi:hypothetical protein
MRTVILQALILGAAAALAAFGQQAIPQELKRPPEAAQNAIAKRPLDHLVKQFWACDYAATAHGILDKDAMMLCAMVSQQLKLAKFDGDLVAMLSWWRENKGHEHEALAARYAAVGQR